MKTVVKTTQNNQKAFSVKTLNKEQIKSRSFDMIRTSFAIEGIHFTESQFATLKKNSTYLKK